MLKFTFKSSEDDIMQRWIQITSIFIEPKPIEHLGIHIRQITQKATHQSDENCYTVCQNLTAVYLWLQTLIIRHNSVVSVPADVPDFWPNALKFTLFSVIVPIAYNNVAIFGSHGERPKSNTALPAKWDPLSKWAKTVFLQTLAAYNIVKTFTGSWTF